jgi:hypothetical protein
VIFLTFRQGLSATKTLTTLASVAKKAFNVAGVYAPGLGCVKTRRRSIAIEEVIRLKPF